MNFSCSQVLPSHLLRSFQVWSCVPFKHNLCRCYHLRSSRVEDELSLLWPLGHSRHLFHDFTAEQHTSNHREEDEQPSTSGSSIEVSTKPSATFPKRERGLRTLNKRRPHQGLSTLHINLSVEPSVAFQCISQHQYHGCTKSTKTSREQVFY